MSAFYCFCQTELACAMADSHLVCAQVGIVLPDTLSGWQSPWQARLSTSEKCQRVGTKQREKNK